MGKNKNFILKDAEGMDQTRILNVFEQIPLQLAKKNDTGQGGLQNR